ADHAHRGVMFFEIANFVWTDRNVSQGQMAKHGSDTTCCVGVQSFGGNDRHGLMPFYGPSVSGERIEYRRADQQNNGPSDGACSCLHVASRLGKRFYRPIQDTILENALFWLCSRIRY